MRRGRRKQQQEVSYFQQRVEPVIKSVVTIGMLVMLFVIIYQFMNSLSAH